MPAGYQKERPYPGKYVTLQKAADAHQVIVVTCHQCRRVVRFLAEDLVRMFDPLRDVTDPPFPCSKCGSKGRLRVEVISPGLEDAGLMEVRRPGPVQRTQTWRTMKLGDPYTPDRRPVRPHSAYYMVPNAGTAAQLIDSYKGWLLERISMLKAENEAMVAGLQLVLRLERGGWQNCTAATMIANEDLMLRMASLVVAIEEEADENRSRIG